MALFETLLFWGPIAFGVVVAASYVGTTLALRTYHDDESLDPSRFVRVEDDGGGDGNGDA